jgi:putative peptidoglycan lipid II flippase
MAYSIGLLGFILVKVLVPGFTSRKDMKTPVRFGIYSMFANMGLNIALVFPLAHAGLALATSLGAFFNATLLLTKLLKDKIYKPGTNWSNFIVKVIFANEIMALFLYLCVDTQQWFVWSAFERVLNLSLWIALGGLIYAVSLLLVGVKPRNVFSK